MEGYAMIDLPQAERSLAEAIAKAAETMPDVRLVVSSPNRSADLSLAEIGDRGRRFGAHLMRIGVRPGDMVAVQLPAWAEWMVACTGIAHAGAVLLPVVSIYGAKELSFILRQSQAVALITPGYWRKFDYAAIVADCGELPALKAHIMIGEGGTSARKLAWETLDTPIQAVSAVPRNADDLAMLVYTSGTTSDPKGVQHTNRTILSEIVTRSMSGIEKTLSPWPPGHVAGAITMMRFLVAGMPLVLIDQWDPVTAAALVEEHHVTASSFTPFHLNGLLDAADAQGFDLSSLRSVLVGATPVPPALIERCAARHMRTYRSYGSSEMPTVSGGNPEDPLEKRLTTEGRPMPGAEIRFVDEAGNDVVEGELAVRGPELFTGYRDPELDRGAFLPGGWFLTGDIGRFDADGYLMITDRKKDVIIRGGENISSREVEDLLFHHPDIAEAAVVAAPDPRMGEIVCAVVIARPGRTLTLEGVREHFSSIGVARQKTPERLILLDAFPRNTTGKVLKQELRTMVREAAKIEGNV
jgi:acyl-CoA synthetase (AMP-forming)/AMP-acid ligase II